MCLRRDIAGLELLQLLHVADKPGAVTDNLERLCQQKPLIFPGLECIQRHLQVAHHSLVHVADIVAHQIHVNFCLRLCFLELGLRLFPAGDVPVEGYHVLPVMEPEVICADLDGKTLAVTFYMYGLEDQ